MAGLAECAYRAQMKSSGQPKRPVNLCLDGALVDRVRELTGNRAEFVERREAESRAEADRLEGAARSWNEFGERQGSFADEFSTL